MNEYKDGEEIVKNVTKQKQKREKLGYDIVYFNSETNLKRKNKNRNL